MAGDLGEFCVVSVFWETKHKKNLEEFAENSEENEGAKIRKIRGTFLLQLSDLRQVLGKSQGRD